VFYDAPDRFEIIHVHDFSNFNFLEAGWRRKLHHVWDMRLMLDKFYPGLCRSTEITGLGSKAYWFAKIFLARRLSSSKWRRNWHLCQHPGELVKYLPEARATAEALSWRSKSSASRCPSSIIGVRASSTPASIYLGSKTEEEREMMGWWREDAGPLSNQVLPPRLPWYKRSKENPRCKTLRA
jgi:hypothetical protein